MIMASAKQNNPGAGEADILRAGANLV